MLERSYATEKTFDVRLDIFRTAITSTTTGPRTDGSKVITVRDSEQASAKTRNDLVSEIDGLEQERQDSIAQIQDEIASLEAEVARLEPLAADERAAAEAEERREVNEAKARVDEMEPIANQAMQRAEAEKKARRYRLQPVIDEAGRAFTEAQKNKDALQRDLAKAKHELESPDLPQEFLSNYMS
ncbi:MAG: hypothetical protein IJ092_15125 [Atopobiaceae bacterium]|nr:hypothetical protein [Atopobiaceae bacterium]